jgi:glycosyltransferase involved in cell wall biosynthesis
MRAMQLSRIQPENRPLSARRESHERDTLHRLEQVRYNEYMASTHEQGPSRAESIRVLEVIAQLNIGGAPLCVITLAENFRAPLFPGFESRIITGSLGRGEAELGNNAAARHIPITSLESLGRELSLRSDLKTIAQLVAIFRRERPHVVHTHTAKAGFVGRLAARIAGVPVVVHTFHGHVFKGYFNPRAAGVFVRLERLFSRLADRIIAPSAELKRQLTQDYRICAPDRVTVIENGIRLDPFLSLPRHRGGFRGKYGIPPDVPLIGIVGRYVPVKNHELFFQAAKRVIERIPDAHLAIVGDGPRRTELKAMAESAGLSARSHFTGWIADMLPIYSALDCAVLSSHNEGCPLALIEAMAAGVPVAATSVGGISDILSDSRYGALTPPGDADALADGILAGLRGRFDLEAARAHVRLRFDSRDMSARTAELYRELLARKGRLPAPL